MFGNIRKAVKAACKRVDSFSVLVLIFSGSF